MAPGGGHLQGPARRVLSGDVGEVGDVPPVTVAGHPRAESGAGDDQPREHRVGAPGRIRRILLGDLPLREHRDQLPQAAHPEHRDVRDEHGLGRALLRDHDLPVSGLGGGEHRRQDPADGTHPAVQSQLPDEDEIGDHLRVDHLGGAEHGGRHGEIEARARLRDGRRAEADGELLLRPGGARVHHGRPDPVPALDQGLVGQPHQGEGGDPGLQVGLDLHDHAVDAHEGDRAGPCEPHQAAP